MQNLPHCLLNQKFCWNMLKNKIKWGLCSQKVGYQPFLVVQLLRVCLTIQGSQVQSLVQEDAACHRATEPVNYNYWACALEPSDSNYWAHTPPSLKLRCPRSHALQQARPAQSGEASAPHLESSPCSPQPEKVCTQQLRPSTAENNNNKIT